MKIRFWGTRGSLPASFSAEKTRKKLLWAIKESRRKAFRSDKEIEAFIDARFPFALRGSYGTNTSCVEIESEEEYVLCDAGTGLRDFGNHIVHSAHGRKVKKPNTFNIFMSHLHWDHIQGFPFFTPAYIPGNTVTIYGGHDTLERAYVRQQEPISFPVPLRAMRADIRFQVLEQGKEYRVGDLKVEMIRQNHPGDSYGYKFSRDGRTIIYSTDNEHKEEAYREDYPFLDFFRDADVLIFDAQYDLIDAIHVKENWGHSSNIIAVELSVKAGVKHLCLYHNEPTMDDEQLDKFLDDTRRYLVMYAEGHPLNISLAYDGLVIDTESST